MPKDMPKECCCVCDQHCQCPANLVGSEMPILRAQCFACGNFVCTNCSSIRKYAKEGKRRLCNNCQVDMDGSEYQVTFRMAMLSGYDRRQSAKIARECCGTTHERRTRKSLV